MSMQKSHSQNMPHEEEYDDNNYKSKDETTV